LAAPLRKEERWIDKEAKMKILRSVFVVLVLCAMAYPQTEDLGMGAYSNDKGAIMLAVDASLVERDLNSPYVLFILYMAAKKEDQNITVSRNDVTMVYNGQEYKMPSVEELRKNYQGEIRDLGFYRQLGKEGIASSWIRLYKFPQRADFFPPVALRAPLAVDEGSMYSYTGFETKCYFKNPGFKKGDTLVLKVRDKKNPELTGEVEVTLK
jgi:hypothetical protein